MIEETHGPTCTTFDVNKIPAKAPPLSTSTGETLNDNELDDLCDTVLADLALTAHV